MADPNELAQRIAKLEQRTEDDHSVLQSLGSVVIGHAQLSERLDNFQVGLNQIRDAARECRDELDNHITETAKAREEAKRFRLNAYLGVAAAVFAAMGSIVALIALVHAG